MLLYNPSMGAFSLINTLAALSGWQRCGLLLILGVMATGALAPFFMTILLIPAFTLLFIFIDNSKSAFSGFVAGWLFGFSFFLSGTYWIANSLLIDSARFAWMIPFATLGLSGILAIYYGVVGACGHLIFRRFNMASVTSRIILFSALCSLAELMRSYLFTGFPWNAIGYSLSAGELLMQPASLVGIHGLNLLTVLFAVLPAIWLYRVQYRLRVLSVAALILGAMAGWSVMHLSETMPSERTINVRMVQGNIAKQRQDKAYQKQVVATYKNLTNQPSAAPLDLIIWPETSFPHMLHESSEWRESLVAFAKPQTPLLAGILRSEGYHDKSKFKVFNSLASVGSDGTIESYDKHHLVPFGEYVPFRSILPIQKIIPGKFDFSRGVMGQTLATSTGLTVAPLICYEAIFSRYAFFEKRPDLLVSVTNDGWFGQSSGPYQHLHMARMRAVEQGLPMIRAANSGVSAVFDAKGRMLGSIALNQRAIADVSLSLGTIDSTLYSRYGVGIYVALLIFLLTIAVIIRPKHGI